MQNDDPSPPISVSSSETTTTTLSESSSFKSNLEEDGVAQINLNSAQSQTVAHGFQMARHALQSIKSKSSSSSSCAAPSIKAEDDSYHCTGYHPLGGHLSSRYNLYREGFVFSDGKLFDVSLDKEEEEEKLVFEASMKEFRTTLHELAMQSVSVLEGEFGLKEGYMRENLGPFMEHSQWHVKQYADAAFIEESMKKMIDEDKMEEKKKDEEPRRPLLLPVHTDPSIISVVVHDKQGVNEGGWGLEYLKKDSDTVLWKQVPLHGHAVATILVGSILARLLQENGKKKQLNYFPPARHRVALPEAADHAGDGVGDDASTSRMTATYFLRPAPNALLKSLLLVKNPSLDVPKPIRFDTWYKRVSKNYGKSGQKKKTKPTDTTPKQQQQQTVIPDNIANPSSSTNEAYCSLIYPHPPLVGKEQYLGGDLGSDGRIYAIPGHAKQVLVIDPNNNDAVSRIGPVFHGDYKWLRSVKVGPIIYGLPCHADSVLRIDTSTGEVSTIGEGGKCGKLNQLWKYHGGVQSPFDNCIYCIPQFSEHILKINPVTEECSLIGGPFVGTHKWYGGLLGKDGAIYGIPQNASSILRIDPASDDVVTLHGDFGLGGHKWHGGTVAADGSIIGIPANKNTILRIDAGNPPNLTEIGNSSTIRTGQHRTDGKYKFLGACVGKDDKVYFIPSDADRVVQINTRTNKVQEVGMSLLDMEPMRHNKWQNGFVGKDGAMYAIPLKGQTVLRVVTSTKPNEEDDDEKNEPVVSTIGGPYPGLNKWEGGVMAENGVMYCMPLNSKAILRITPASKSS